MGNQNNENLLDFKGFPGRWKIIRSTKDTKGKLLEMKFEINSTTGNSPPVHIHPHAEEQYEVLSGVLEVKVEGKWKKIQAGEKHTVLPGIPHTFRNKVPVSLINIHKPALRYEQFFRRFHKLMREQGVKLPPNNFKSFILMGMLFSAHEEEVISKSPPQFIMRGLAWIGKRLNYRLPD